LDFQRLREAFAGLWPCLVDVDTLTPCKSSLIQPSARKRCLGVCRRSPEAQFMSDQRIAMFELTVVDGVVKVVDEKHCQLVAASSITSDNLQTYPFQGG
jgi:hypothetical protein